MPGVRVVDLFCGTGSLGLEALSRGAEHALMVENDRDAVRRLKKNISRLNFGDLTTIIQADAFKYIARGLKTGDNANNENRSFQLAFVDPPYALSRLTKSDSKLGGLLTGLDCSLAEKAIVVIRHEKRVELLRRYEHLHQLDRREYGSMAVTFLEKVVE
jgi:16S rRNA (guanine966-N2)-methyltransferase